MLEQMVARHVSQASGIKKSLPMFQHEFLAIVQEPKGCNYSLGGSADCGVALDTKQASCKGKTCLSTFVKANADIAEMNQVGQMNLIRCLSFQGDHLDKLHSDYQARGFKLKSQELLWLLSGEGDFATLDRGAFGFGTGTGAIGATGAFLGSLLWSGAARLLRIILMTLGGPLCATSGSTSLALAFGLDIASAGFASALGFGGTLAFEALGGKAAVSGLNGALTATVFAAPAALAVVGTALQGSALSCVTWVCFGPPLPEERRAAETSNLAEALAASSGVGPMPFVTAVKTGSEFDSMSSDSFPLQRFTQISADCLTICSTSGCNCSRSSS